MAQGPKNVINQLIKVTLGWQLEDRNMRTYQGGTSHYCNEIRLLAGVHSQHR
jgi:alanine-alpha-ketoisovalerate/valine-pyruvate aminotransferase